MPEAREKLGGDDQRHSEMDVAGRSLVATDLEHLAPTRAFLGRRKGAEEERESHGYDLYAPLPCQAGWHDAAAPKLMAW